jgi:hypothetical protein
MEFVVSAELAHERDVAGDPSTIFGGIRWRCGGLSG